MSQPPQNAHPLKADQIYLTHTGLETDLIFNHGVALPDFATFPLLDSDTGRAALKRCHLDLIAVAQRFGFGCILESHGWMANPDRAQGLGYAQADLDRLNQASIAFLHDLRQDATPDLPLLISANIGPRSDAYQQTATSAAEAEAYHSPQIAALAGTPLDLITAYTLSDPNEAIGIIRAAKHFDLPVVISFTVETDGALISGQPLSDAIRQVDAATDGAAAYFMVNCAHPDHLSGAVTAPDIGARLRGVVANASRCSHAELDNATELDAGDPVAFGRQMTTLRAQRPELAVLGGCCGTDMRHLTCLAQGLTMTA